jgi:hypothetical protein
MVLLTFSCYSPRRVFGVDGATEGMRGRCDSGVCAFGAVRVFAMGRAVAMMGN